MKQSKLLKLFKDLSKEIIKKSPRLVNAGEDIIELEEGAEEALLVVYKLKQMIDELDKEVKDAIKAKALELNPEVKKIKASRLVVSLQNFGYKYGIDESNLDQIPPGLIKKTVKVYANSKEIDEWSAEHGGKLPAGIISNRDDDPQKKGVKFYPKRNE